MKAFLLASVLLAAKLSAFPSLGQELQSLHDVVQKRSDPYPYIAPGPNDLRAPCPGTNTLANHGYINRNGRNITQEAYQNGFLNAFGFATGITQVGAKSAINLCSSITNKTCTHFNLDILNIPHAIEHDGSLSRYDYREKFRNPADNVNFSSTVFNDYTMKIVGDQQYIALKMSKTLILDRFAQQNNLDIPGWFLLKNATATTEHSFLHCAMNDASAGGVLPNSPRSKIEWVQYWFEHQRLPTEIGWVRPTVASSVFRSLSSYLSANTGRPGASTSLTASSVTIAARAAATPTSSLDPQSSTVASRAALATASQLAGPAPAELNPYDEEISPEQWSSYIAANSIYVHKVNTLYSQHYAAMITPSPKS